MKKILTALALISLIFATGAIATPSNSDQGDTQAYTAIVPSMGAITEWVTNFTNSYNENGIYQAVAEVFEDGRTTDEIVINALDVKGVNPQNLVAALYCAGAKHEDIRAASVDVGISELILVAGFETAKTVCGDEIADTQAYTPLGPNYAGVPDGGGKNGTYGSPSGFTN